jgi:DNA-binding XRE family transcriptional regulator
MKTIRELREGRGWTQFALALKVGVQPQAVYLWEQGRRLPKVVPMRKLGIVFGLCSDDIALEPQEDIVHPPREPLADGQSEEVVPSRDRQVRVVARHGRSTARHRDDG